MKEYRLKPLDKLYYNDGGADSTPIRYDIFFAESSNDSKYIYLIANYWEPIFNSPNNNDANEIDMNDAISINDEGSQISNTEEMDDDYDNYSIIRKCRLYKISIVTDNTDESIEDYGEIFDYHDYSDYKSLIMTYDDKS